VFVLGSIDAMRITSGQIMTQSSASDRSQSLHSARALIFAGALILAPALLANSASAQVLGYANTPQSAFPYDPATDPELSADGDASFLPERLRRAVVAYDTSEAPGTVVVDSPNTALYYVLGQGQAIRYGVGVGREGFGWSGVQTITRKTEWPDWYPPAEMIARQPYLPRMLAGGPTNPLGARALYLGSSQYRIHGTNDPTTIGKFVSSGCIRMTNADVADLFRRVDVGTKVVVLATNAPQLDARGVRQTTVSSGPVVTTRPSGRRATGVSMSSLY
jgi:lipoprotein-anchoring transpeptidase ErfK/SrfK